ncbi:MAG TPA: hypothetical protein VJ276_15425 [Thermoanaerobaculia bacterium]|nr:hypothetical protein [Thermoanaerobaculia bacterium]
MADPESPFVFAVMPFSDAFADVYLRGIKAACNQLGIRCERADEQVFTESIVARIYGQIVTADVVVAEVTEPNPNVYYEIGYARAFGKRLLLITRSASAIPFDLKGYPHIIHGGDIDRLRSEVASHVRALLLHREEGEQITAVGFPWPALVRRSMAVLDAAERRFAELGQNLTSLAGEFAEFAESVGVRGAPDIQVSLVRRDRTLLYHDFSPLIGTPARHVGSDRQNIYDEIFCRTSGAVAWVDAKSNSPRSPRARTNVALFRTLGASGAKVVVELHDELR